MALRLSPPQPRFSLTPGWVSDFCASASPDKWGPVMWVDAEGALQKGAHTGLGGHIYGSICHLPPPTPWSSSSPQSWAFHTSRLLHARTQMPAWSRNTAAHRETPTKTPWRESSQRGEDLINGVRARCPMCRRVIFSALHSQRNQDHFQYTAKLCSLSQGSTMTSSCLSNKIQTPQAAIILQASFIAVTPSVLPHHMYHLI